MSRPQLGRGVRLTAAEHGTPARGDPEGSLTINVATCADHQSRESGGSVTINVATCADHQSRGSGGLGPPG